MGAGVEHTRGGLAADQNGPGAFSDDIRRADTNCHVPHASGRQAADQHGGRAGTGDRAADMRDQNRYHRANMHVGKARCGESHGQGLPRPIDIVTLK